MKTTASVPMTRAKRIGRRRRMVSESWRAIRRSPSLRHAGEALGKRLHLGVRLERLHLLLRFLNEEEVLDLVPHLAQRTRPLRLPLGELEDVVRSEEHTSELQSQF